MADDESLQLVKYVTVIIVTIIGNAVHGILTNVQSKTLSIEL